MNDPYAHLCTTEAADLLVIQKLEELRALVPQMIKDIEYDFARQEPNCLARLRDAYVILLAIHRLKYK